MVGIIALSIGPVYGGRIMLVRRRLIQFVAIFLILSLALAACERPIPGGDEGDEVITDTSADNTSDAETSSEEPPEVDTSAEEEASPEPEESPESDTPRVEEEATATPEPIAEAESETKDAEAEEVAEEAEETAETEEAAPEDSEETTTETTTEETSTETTAETPQTHTVAAGENLYRIGLQYGISWVTLAEYNNLPNANSIKVGQVLNIPGENADAPQAEPTPSPMTETTYIVKAGDNLFKIGLAYGISWIQIAEANGIVNPNQIIVGQELKIPVDTPGPAPQFTHTVKAGETLFLISLRYGVSWTAVAEANDISSPYVIYVGQSLVIPGE